MYLPKIKSDWDDRIFREKIVTANELTELYKELNQCVAEANKPELDRKDGTFQRTNTLKQQIINLEHLQELANSLLYSIGNLKED